MKEEYKQLEKQIAKAKNNSLQLYKDKLNGLINDDQYKLLSNAFNSEIEKYQERLKLVSDECLSDEHQINLSKESVLSKYRDIDKLTFELVHELVNTVYVGKINTETNEREIEIHWKF